MHKSQRNLGRSGSSSGQEEEEEEEEELFKTKLPARRPRVQPIRGRAEDEEDVMVVSWTC